MVRAPARQPVPPTPRKRWFGLIGDCVERKTRSSLLARIRSPGYLSSYICRGHSNNLRFLADILVRGGSPQRGNQANIRARLTSLRVKRLQVQLLWPSDTTRRSTPSAAAVHIDRVRGHEFASVGANEQNQFADLLRFAEALHRHIVEELLDQLG